MFWLLEHPEANGILNIGSGKARTWNDLANSVYSAMDKIPDINYIDIAATEGPLSVLHAGGHGVAGTPWLRHSVPQLEDGVSDYIKNYLMNPDPYL